MQQQLFYKRNVRGVTLLEVFLAVAVLMLAIVPIFRYTTHDATKAIETERIQQSEDLLQSVREELVSMPFRNFDIATEGTEEPGPFILPSGFYPVTYSRVMELQEKYRDFNLIGTWSYLVRNDRVDRNMVQVDWKVNWTRPDGIPIERASSILIVRP